MKAIAKANRVSIPDLLVLARGNDPFFTGSETSRAMAEWFADLWQQFGYGRGVHLRRVHYQLVSQVAPQKPDGTLYENTEGDWGYICHAGKYARDLDLVSADAFVDRRNPEPHIFYNAPEDLLPGVDLYFGPWELPSIDADIRFNDWSWGWPDLDSKGYTYSEGCQPVLMEIWAEKSTMDDVLIPLCRRYGVNLVIGLGYMSDTSFTNNKDYL